MDNEYKSRAAQELLNSESFKDAFKELRDEATVTWTRTATEDKDGREQLYYLQLALSLVESRLQAWADNDKVILSKAVKKPNNEETE